MRPPAARTAGGGPRHAAPRMHDPGDDWAVVGTGDRYWGKFGAAGLLAYDPKRGVLLQHRAQWNHHGGTWAPPGGARHQGESAEAGALREAWEEARIPAPCLLARAHSVLDLDGWTYTTVIADVIAPFEPAVNDAESIALEWVAPERVTGYSLHPAFRVSWASLRRYLGIRPAIILDAAAAATERTPPIERAAEIAASGIRAADIGLPGRVWFPSVTIAAGRRDHPAADTRALARLRVLSPDTPDADPFLAGTRQLTATEHPVIAVTDDTDRAARCNRAGAIVRSTRWLYDAEPGTGPHGGDST